MVERSSIPDKEVESVEIAPWIVPQAEMSALSVVIWSLSCVIGACRRSSYGIDLAGDLAGPKA